MDAFNPEFSRDIEPMKGGFGDNYYYQLAAFLRRFKGAREIPAADGQIAISEDGGVERCVARVPRYIGRYHAPGFNRFWRIQLLPEQHGAQ